MATPQPKRKRTDAELLDFLAKQGDPGILWVARKSSRGYRLHQSPCAEAWGMDPGVGLGADPREAIGAAIDAEQDADEDM